MNNSTIRIITVKLKNNYLGNVEHEIHNTQTSTPTYLILRTICAKSQTVCHIGYAIEFKLMVTAQL